MTPRQSSALDDASPRTREDLREQMAFVLYEQERKRGENVNFTLSLAYGRVVTGASIESWDEAKHAFLSDADAILAAFPQLTAAPSSEPLGGSETSYADGASPRTRELTYLLGEIAAAICGHWMVRGQDADSLDDFHGFVQVQLLRIVTCVQPTPDAEQARRERDEAREAHTLAIVRAAHARARHAEARATAAEAERDSHARTIATLTERGAKLTRERGESHADVCEMHLRATTAETALRDANARVRVLEESLTEIAAFHDTGAERRLKDTGSYSSFDEPWSVQIARAALSASHPEGSDDR